MLKLNMQNDDHLEKDLNPEEAKDDLQKNYKNCGDTESCGEDNSNCENNDNCTNQQNNNMSEEETQGLKMFEKMLEDFNNLNIKNKNLEEQYAKLNLDLINIEKRNKDLEKDSIKKGIKNVVKALAPILNIFSIVEKSYENNKDVLDGFNMIFLQFLDVLKNFNVIKKEIQINEVFDSNFCNAIKAIEGGASGTIAQVASHCYLLDNEVIFYAQVVVYK
jgi:molecular chaperone GrpE (heat shock protein)